MFILTSLENVQKYFTELHHILVKYNLMDNPESIYNVDEKGIQQNFKPSFVVGPRDSTTNVITSEKSNTTTILGCGNAIGQQIPPYFVFAGARMRSELLEGASPGAQGTVSKTGWSNGEVFKNYLETHFINYANGKRPLLLLYDGHRSHISPSIIDWATEHDIILYVLPPHTSHILQHMDVGCFGPFSKVYSNECGKFQRETGKIVDRYNVCMIACKAYATALSVKNLQGAFKKSGIYPFCPDSVDTDLFETNKLRSELQSSYTEELCQSVAPDHDQPESDLDETIP
ncbi:uncharacterized protein LOC128549946 [Mercenaria mercenaria]|uniref:uncharacterized protein LOC128549946 n=1 Tax=Mercenaria mercenaria TaxID=6596 RepID=UPI00234E91C5|nr:uncharacterized protein LOC128549946 [Mercenaria mercenaria]